MSNPWKLKYYIAETVATELYDALRKCVECLESPSKMQGDALATARAILAKIEGEQ